MRALGLKPTHKLAQHYYAALRHFDDLGVSHEGTVKSTFHGLLDHYARHHDWTLVTEWGIHRPWRFSRRSLGFMSTKEIHSLFGHGLERLMRGSRIDEDGKEKRPLP